MGDFLNPFLLFQKNFEYSTIVIAYVHSLLSVLFLLLPSCYQFAVCYALTLSDSLGRDFHHQQQAEGAAKCTDTHAHIQREQISPPFSFTDWL